LSIRCTSPGRSLLFIGKLSKYTKACTKVSIVSVSRMNNHSWLLLINNKCHLHKQCQWDILGTIWFSKGGCVSITRYYIKSFYFVIRLYCGVVYKIFPSVAAIWILLRVAFLNQTQILSIQGACPLGTSNLKCSYNSSSKSMTLHYCSFGISSVGLAIYPFLFSSS
jgi:hypothetical protein